MNLSELQGEAESLPDDYVAATKSATELIALSLKSFATGRNVKSGNIRDKFRHHCTRQSRFLAKIEGALSLALNGHPDIILFLTGSVAKLEFDAGVSDVDFVGVADTRQQVWLVCNEVRAMVESLKTYSPSEGPPTLDQQKALEGMVNLISEVFDRDANFTRTKSDLASHLFSRIAPKERERLVGISGMPYHGGQYFFSKEDLTGSVGKFNEPSWATSHRASLLFESAYFSLTRKDDFVQDIRERCNDCYHITQDLLSPKVRFPVLGALLVGHILKSAVLAQIAKFKSFSAAQQEKGVLEAEILKTAISRIVGWNIHLMMLHVLYWKALLVRDTNRELEKKQILVNLSQIPLRKILQIPLLVEKIAAKLTPRNWDREFAPLKRATKERIEAKFDEIYKLLGPENQAVPLLSLYVPFLLTALSARKSKLKLTLTDESDIERSVAEIFSCLKKCEELTLLLMKNSRGNHTDEMLYLKLFGSALLDRGMTRRILATETPRRRDNRFW
jgi:hypothetical protein